MWKLRWGYYVEVSVEHAGGRPDELAILTEQ
jgi:hypothetical protein